MGETGDIVKTLKSSKTSGVRSIRCARITPDGMAALVVSADGDGKVWSLDADSLICDLSGEVWSAEFSPDGRLIVGASEDDDEDTIACVWNAESGELLYTLSGHKGSVKSAAFSPDGMLIVTASADGTARLWSPSENGRFLRALAGHRDSVSSAVFSPNSQLVVTASADSTACIWTAATGASLHVLRGHSKGITSAKFSCDGDHVVTAGLDGAVRL